MLVRTALIGEEREPNDHVRRKAGIYLPKYSPAGKCPDPQLLCQREPGQASEQRAAGVSGGFYFGHGGGRPPVPQPPRPARGGADPNPSGPGVRGEPGGGGRGAESGGVPAPGKRGGVRRRTAPALHSGRRSGGGAGGGLSGRRHRIGPEDHPAVYPLPGDRGTEQLPGL